MKWRSTSRGAPASTHCDAQELSVASRLASEIRERWRGGEKPDVTAVLADHPKLQRYRSVMLDLVCEEYHLRRAAGEQIGADSFSRRFPGLQRSIYKILEVREVLDGESGRKILEGLFGWPEAGDVFLGFTLLAELGRGAFGRAYLASESALGDRLVALKIAPGAGEEAEILGKLRHPNIVPVHSVQRDPASGLTAICMPYLGRATLADVLEEVFVGDRPPAEAGAIVEVLRRFREDSEAPEVGALPVVLRSGTYVEGAVLLVAQLAEALAYAHGRGVCHRDLKPSNVLLTADGRPLLLDFNLSSDQQINAGRVGGTLPYMAPEQLALLIGEGSDQPVGDSARSDLFSLGVILYELLTGRLPFGTVGSDRSLEKVAAEWLEQQRRGAEPLREKNPEIDQSVARLIHDCVAFEPQRRPTSAGELARALRGELSAAKRGKRWLRVHRRLVSAAVSLAVFAAVCGAGFLALRDPYSVRQLQRGTSCLEQGDYQLAVKCLDRSVRAAPDCWEALFARGLAYQGLGELRWAFDDFMASSQLAPRPETEAYKGYCWSRLGHPNVALRYYETALRGGFCSPWVLNNLGFHCVELNRLVEAEGHLRRAIEADGRLGPALHNLILVFIRRGCAGQSIPPLAFETARKAEAVGPPSASLYRDVAVLYALAAKSDPTRAPQAVECLRQAIMRGLDPARCKSDPFLGPLCQDPAVADLARRTVASKPLVEPAHLVAPR